jgi:hypothetical protein
MAFRATKQKVLNRGVPPDSFLNELIAWGGTAPDELFAPNENADVYSSVVEVLGPGQGLPHRRAAMLEVMRVLAGFESSWNWNAGVDTTNPTSTTPTTIEAGAFQVSANSMSFGPELKELVLRKVGSLDGNAFQKAMKRDHPLAMEYIARLLRRTVNANGPVKRHTAVLTETRPAAWLTSTPECSGACSIWRNRSASRYRSFAVAATIRTPGITQGAPPTSTRLTASMWPPATRPLLRFSNAAATWEQRKCWGPAMPGIRLIFTRAGRDPETPGVG